ncbi:MAG TPA: hypothetical protein VI544_01555 [Candidatus Nanoarchaeia archaeon]|nr:hypothetical protein [Candidatus Woesearchaeota archaeon]HLF53841.1 hypothetical protein [Candidatus Nanoarchaeia archaeon]
MTLDYSKKKPVVFPYKLHDIVISGKLERVLRPMALVGVKKENFKMNALIDSGSDRTISFLDPFGYQLGVGDELEGEPDELRGLTGTEKAFPKHVDIWIGEHRLNIPIFWITRPFKINEDYEMILGRKIIFDNFDVLFRQKEKKVYFYKQ